MQKLCDFIESASWAVPSGQIRQGVESQGCKNVNLLPYLGRKRPFCAKFRQPPTVPLPLFCHKSLQLCKILVTPSLKLQEERAGPCKICLQFYRSDPPTTSIQDRRNGSWPAIGVSAGGRVSGLRRLVSAQPARLQQQTEREIRQQEKC